MRGTGSFRLLAIDLDGTLLDDKFRVSARTREAVRLAAAAGVRVVLATGRPFLSARPYAVALGLDLPLICYNGALVQEALSRRRWLFRPLPAEVAVEVAAFLESEGHYVKVYLDEMMFVAEATPDTEWFSRHYGVPYRCVGRLSAFLRRVAAEGREPPPMLVGFVGEDAAGRALVGRLRDRWAGRAECYRPSPWAVDVVAAGASKGAALAHLASLWGVGPGETMAVGNAGNDVEMMRWAGLGVAVANATEEARAAAAAVVADNNHDGVAEAIERFVLPPS